MSLTNKENPLVSIVIPCYNHALFVQETIKSVIEQDYQNIELIIIDDGSVDNSVEVIQQMLPQCKERFVRFEFRFRPNKGLCATLNEAIEWCEGEFFAPVASDDIILENKTSLQTHYLLNNLNSIGVFGGVEIIGNESNILKLNNVKRYSFKDIFLHRHLLPAPTQFLRLDAVKKIGGYNESLIMEDWSVWLFLTESGGTLDCLNTTLCKYRQHGSNISANFDKMHSGRLQVLNLFKKNILYKKAFSRIYMVAAYDFQKSNIVKSLSFVKKSLKVDFGVLFDFMFIKYLLRFYYVLAKRPQ